MTAKLIGLGLCDETRDMYLHVISLWVLLLLATRRDCDCEASH